jgi:acetylornithine deacetylase
MDRLEDAIDMLSRLVAFDTVSSKSNLPLIDFVETYLREQDVRFVRAPNASGDKAALFVTIGPDADGGVLLSGHTDVVPVAGQAWSGDPFTRRRDATRLYGRGAVDMKGFDAACLAMIPEFKAAQLSRPIHILLSYDEETTCLGPLDVIARFGTDLPLPSAVIVGEPTSMEVADAHKSVATYVTRVRGFEIHSANLHRGVSAVHVACKLVCELERLGEELRAAGDPSWRFDPPFSTIHVGVIHGGTARNIAAKDCEFQWEFRALPGAPPNFAYDRLEAYCDALRRTIFVGFPDAGVETTIENQVPGLAPQPGSEAESLALRLAKRNGTIAVPYATEAGQFQRAGVAAVVCGPGRIDQAHQPDEFIDIAELAACLEFLRGLAQQLRA